MSELYSYNIELPLTYYTFDLRSEERDSEFIMGLDNNISWDEVYEVNEIVSEEKGLEIHTQETVSFSIISELEKDSEKVPKPYFIMKANNLVAHNQQESYENISDVLHRCCLILSMLISRSNVNKQGYQPRVQYDYHEIKWTKNPYLPYEQLMETDEEEYVDENGVLNICCKVKVNIGCSVYTKIFGFIHAEDFMKYYRHNDDASVEYMLEEYFLALGQENMTSKFFHLFSIIEFIEKQYIELSGASRLLSDEEIGFVMQGIKEYTDFPKEKGNKVISSLKNKLTDMTDLGRGTKLVNILHAMGIDRIENCGSVFEVNKEMVQQIIDLRNTYYHGGHGQKAISVNEAVTRLMYLCEYIIRYSLE